jgi:hypothetical protein
MAGINSQGDIAHNPAIYIAVPTAFFFFGIYHDR